MMNHLLVPIMLLLLSAFGKTGALYLPSAEQDTGVIAPVIEKSAPESEEVNRGSL